MELKWFNFPRGEAFALPTEWREAFSLPTEWWIEAGMDRFEPGADLSYSARPQLASKLYLLAAIEPPRMGQRLRRGHGGFERDRMVAVLRDIALRREIWPIEIAEGASGPYLYSLHHGAHRFHASLAAGFLHIPAIILAR
jgi:hypothetical protein